jgi:hypothetical protein
MTSRLWDARRGRWTNHREGSFMKNRKALGLVLAAIAALGGTLTSSDADAALTGSTCTVTSVGWRDNIKALRTICGGTVFWNRETAGNPSCTQQTSMDVVKLFQTTANAALLSGKSIQIYYDTQGGCNTSDLVIREMYLLN